MAVDLAIHFVFRGEGAGLNFFGISLHAVFDHGAELAIDLDEFWRPRVHAKHVFEHENLAVTVGGGADADGGDRDFFGDLGGERFDHAL